MSFRKQHDRERELLLCCARTEAAPPASGLLARAPSGHCADTSTTSADRPIGGRTAQQGFGDQVRVHHVLVVRDARFQCLRVHRAFTFVDPLS